LRLQTSLKNREEEIELSESIWSFIALLVKEAQSAVIVMQNLNGED